MYTYISIYMRRLLRKRPTDMKIYIAYFVGGVYMHTDADLWEVRVLKVRSGECV